MTMTETELVTLGWREWLSLPDLGIMHIKAKVDTGARTSALHAFYVDPYRYKGAEWVRFGIHPIQQNNEFSQECKAIVLDRKLVSDSGGHKEERYFIETTFVVGEKHWRAQLTLTNRDSMRFRMLLGRTALQGRFLVNSAVSYQAGIKPTKRCLQEMITATG